MTEHLTIVTLCSTQLYTVSDLCLKNYTQEFIRSDLVRYIKNLIVPIVPEHSQEFLDRKGLTFNDFINFIKINKGDDLHYIC